MAEKIDPEAALAADGDLIWVHLSTNNREAQDWLGEKAGLADYIVDALTATESRPRCEAAGKGAFINLRGNVADKAALPDALASVRIWASGPRVFSALRKPLTALDTGVASSDAGENGERGEPIANFAAPTPE